MRRLAERPANVALPACGTSFAAELDEQHAGDAATSARSRARRYQDQGDRVTGRERPVVPREPRLRQAEREEEQGAGAEAAPAAHERDERNEPDQVLRREHLVEGDERGDRRRGREQRRPRRSGVAAPREDDPDRRRRRRSRAPSRDPLRARPRARSAPARRASRSSSSGRIPRCSRRHQHRRAEALDLQRPVELVGELAQSPCGARIAKGTKHAAATTTNAATAARAAAPPRAARGRRRASGSRTPGQSFAAKPSPSSPP